MRIVRCIALEFLDEATSARDRICSYPCERLVRLAVCVVDVKIRRGEKATEYIVLPTLYEMQTENFDGNIYRIDKLYILQRWG